MRDVEKRSPEQRRVALDLPVQLVHEGIGEVLPAALRNLGHGGFSISAAIGLAPGAEMDCRIDPMDGGLPIEGLCRVAWTHALGVGDAAMGLSFVELEAESKARLDAIIADLDAAAGDATPQAATPRVRVVRGRVWLTPRAVAQPETWVSAALPLRRRDDMQDVWEGPDGVSGRLQDWCLRLDGAEPRLELRLVHQEELEAEEFSEAELLDVEEELGLSRDLLQRLDSEDTLPDASASEWPAQEMRESAAPRIEAEELVYTPAPVETSARPETHFEGQAARVLRALQSIALAVWQRLRGLGLQGLQRLRQLVSAGRRPVPRVQQGRRRMQGRPAPARSRRSTTRSGRVASRRRVGLLPLSLAVAAVGLLAWAVWPTPQADAVNQALLEAQAKSEAESVVEPQPAAPSSAKRTATPGTVPADSPYAVDLRASADSAAKAPAVVPAAPVATGQRFASGEVKEARSFLIRMSRAVELLKGEAQKGGFVLKALGALALDRAGPIAEGHPLVESAMILNRGDHAELSVRFREGTQPAYEVTARGAILEVRVAQQSLVAASAR